MRPFADDIVVLSLAVTPPPPHANKSPSASPAGALPFGLLGLLASTSFSSDRASAQPSSNASGSSSGSARLLAMARCFARLLALNSAFHCRTTLLAWLGAYVLAKRAASGRRPALTRSEMHSAVSPS